MVYKIGGRFKKIKECILVGYFCWKREIRREEEIELTHKF